MPSPPRNLKLLSRCAPSSAGAILAHAIPHADPDELAVLCRAAIRTGQPGALAAVLRVAHRVGMVELTAALSAVPSDPLAAAVRRVLARPDRQTIENTIAVIARRGDPAFARHLPDLLAPTDDRDDLPEQAAEALLAIAVSTIGRNGRRIPATRAAEQLDAALATAGRDYRRHRQDAVLVALAVAAARPGPSVSRLLAEEDHPAVLALRGAADDVREPLVGGNLIRWLGVEALAGSAARRLHRLNGLETWGEALRDGHLLLAPRRRRRLWRADRPLQCMPSSAEAAALPDRAQGWVPMLVGALDLSAHARLQRLADMIAMPSPIARLRGLLILLGQQGRRAGEAIVPYCFDRDGAVARIAAQRLLADGEKSGAALWTKLMRSAHPAVSRRAAANAARSGVTGFFQQWHRLPDAQRRAAALHLLAANRLRFVAGMRGMLLGGEARDQLEAIRLVRRLRLEDDLAEELIELTRSESARVASAAVAAIPVGPAHSGFEALLSAIRHDNARVRANAIERLARLAHAESTEVISRLSGSEENRLRANAIRAILRIDRRRGLADLRRMLADPRPLHRISAIWLARAGGVLEAAPDLHRLAREDRLPEIRTRAHVAIRWLGRRRASAQIGGAAR